MVRAPRGAANNVRPQVTTVAASTHVRSLTAAGAHAAHRRMCCLQPMLPTTYVAYTCGCILLLQAPALKLHVALPTRPPSEHRPAQQVPQARSVDIVPRADVATPEGKTEVTVLVRVCSSLFQRRSLNQRTVAAQRQRRMNAATYRYYW